jgi:hypothetical protein
MSCAFVSMVNFSIVRSKVGEWSVSARRDISLCNVIVYSLWAIRNAGVCPGLRSDGRYTIIMWLHTLSCAVCAIWNIIYLLDRTSVGAGVGLVVVNQTNDTTNATTSGSSKDKNS